MASPDVAQAANSLSQSLSQAVSSASSGSIATITMSTPTDGLVAAQASTGWLGLFGRIILVLINLTTTILYWTLRITTINVPTFLYTLFSTSWTVTMNTTTL